MILIGKTANCLLGAYVMAHSAVLKAVDEFVRIRAFQFAIRTVASCTTLRQQRLYEQQQ